MKLHALLPLSAIAALALVGCSNQGNNDQEPTASPSTSTSASPTPSPAETMAPGTTATESEAPLPEEPIPAETPVQAVPKEVAPEQPVPTAAAAPTIDDFFATGGACISDIWSSTLPRTDDFQAQVNDYCEANQLGDWSYGYDPMDPMTWPQESNPYAIGAPRSEEEQRQYEMGQCNALELENAVSGDIQYCYMEYGISVD